MSKDEIDDLIWELSSIAAVVRWKARDALVKIGKPAVPALIDALKDEDSSVQWNVAWALGEIKDARAVPALIVALKDDGNFVRMYAAMALGDIKDFRAVPALIDALKDDDSDVRGKAADALGVIVPSLTDNRLREMGRLLRKALGKAEGREKKNSVYLLEKINNRRNEILEPEAKKLKPPKILKRRKKPKRRMWRAVWG